MTRSTRTRRALPLVAVVVAAVLGAGTVAHAAPASPTPTSSGPPSGTPTSSPPEGPPPCDPTDPTAVGDCATGPKAKQEMIDVVDPATGQKHEYGPVWVIRPLIVMDEYVGPTHKRVDRRIQIDHPCGFYRTYDGNRMWTYPAPEYFRGRYPDSSHWWTYGSSPPSTSTFNFLQLPDGVGLIEPDWIYSVTLTPGEHYNSPIHLTPAQVYDHRTDTGGYWWNYNCDYTKYRGIDNVEHTPGWLKARLAQLHQQQPVDWEFWQTGQENPPAIPPPFFDPRDIANVAVPAPNLQFAPPEDANTRIVTAETRLPTWTWVTPYDPAAQNQDNEQLKDQIGRYPVEVKIAGPPAMDVVATPGPITVSGLPDGASTHLACNGGGTIYHAGMAPDASNCTITFARATDPDADPVNLTFTQTWRVTANGRPAGTLRKNASYNFRVRETQSAGGN